MRSPARTVSAQPASLALRDHARGARGLVHRQRLRAEPLLARREHVQGREQRARSAPPSARPRHRLPRRRHRARCAGSPRPGPRVAVDPPLQHAGDAFRRRGSARRSSPSPSRDGPQLAVRRRSLSRRRHHRAITGSFTPMWIASEADDHPGEREVRLPEGEGPRVPLEGVDEAGGELDQRRRDEAARSTRARARPTTVRTGGHSNSSGKTVYSFPSSSGMQAIPAVMCTPCVTRYSHSGRRREHHPGQRVLDEVAVQAGAKQTRNALPEQPAEHHRGPRMPRAARQRRAGERGRRAPSMLVPSRASIPGVRSASAG